MINEQAFNKRRAMRIRAVMEERGVSQDAIATACSKEINTVQKWISGNQTITDANLDTILQLLGITIKQLDTPILDLFGGQESTAMEGFVHIFHSCGFDHYIKMTKEQCRLLLKTIPDLTYPQEIDEENE